MTPALVTQAGPDVILGNPITDSSTLIGTAFQPGSNGPNATYPSINADMVTPANGTITFTSVRPGNCTDVPTGFTAIVVTVSGDSYPPRLHGQLHPDAGRRVHLGRDLQRGSPKHEGRRADRLSGCE